MKLKCLRYSTIKSIYTTSKCLIRNNDRNHDVHAVVSPGAHLDLGRSMATTTDPTNSTYSPQILFHSDNSRCCTHILIFCRNQTHITCLSYCTQTYDFIIHQQEARTHIYTTHTLTHTQTHTQIHSEKSPNPKVAEKRGKQASRK